MAVVSHTLQAPSWTFSTITNNYEGRVSNRKRGFDTDCGEGKRTEVDGRGSHKKARTLASIENLSDAFDTPDASHDPRAPHEFLAGEWRYEPLDQHTTPTHISLEEETASAEPIDVEKVITILLQALNAQNADDKAENENEHKSYTTQPHRRITSPLSGSSERVQFVRKAVGGSCRGKVDPGLKKWVLCKNHYDDIRSYHPSRRSPEWIEALHEMGWENLHPTYMSQSQHTFRTLTAFSTSCDDWIDVEDAEGQRGEEARVEGSGENNDDELEGIPEDVWDLGLQVPPPRRTIRILA